jgi:tRNA/rRNA methyltransferase
MPQRICLENVAIVLNRPQFPENIGAAARAACNMGIGSLIVVCPQNLDEARVIRMATPGARHIVDTIKIYDSLKDALKPFNWVVGTTARLGGQRSVVSPPDKIAEKLIPLSYENRIAVLFGPEDRGLTNTEIRLCHDLVNIPTADFSSLNLAQAVMIMAYEIHTAGLEKPAAVAPRLASRHELDGMYEQLKKILVKINYINPDNPDYWISRVRRFFNRLQLRAGEVSIIRGICRQVEWYAGKRFQDGKNLFQEGKNHEVDSIRPKER